MRNDSERYPVELITAALGERAVLELKKSHPKRPTDRGFMVDRFVINGGAIGYWLFIHFKLNIFNDADCARVVDVDPLAETITITGRGEFRIPHWCYIPTGLEFEDPRPANWPGIPRPEEELAHADLCQGH
jgi:hypothetical protein